MKVLQLTGGLDPSHGGPAVQSMNSIIATQRTGAGAIVDGIPAIVSRKIEIAEIIEHHGGGQIIKPATDQIISAIEEYLEQQDRRNTLSQQAIRCAEQALSFKKHGEAAVTAYQKLLEKTGKH